MKRWMCVLLAMLLCVGLIGCGRDYSMQEANNNTYEDAEETSVATEPQTVELTTYNVDEYLLYSIEVVDFTEDYTAVLDKATGYANVCIKTMSKQNVEFQNVAVTFKMIAKQERWQGFGIVNVGGDTREIRLPFDGRREDNFRIMSKLVPDFITSPTLSLEVVSVSGSVVVK